MRRARAHLLVAALLPASTVASGQVCTSELFEEGFESYEAGRPLIEQQPCHPGCPPGLSWQPWDENPTGGRAEVSDLFASRGANALRITGGGSDPDDIVHTYHDLGLFGGTYQYQLDVYVPGDFHGDSYLVMLTGYESGGDKSWATQLRWSDTGHVISDFDDGVQEDVPLVFDEWVTVRVIMDLDHDRQEIFYGDRFVIAKSWCQGITCDPTFEAMNLFGNDASAVYYDSLRLCAMPPICAEDVDRDWLVGFSDLLAVLSAWGPYDECPPARREDLDADCTVGFTDLLAILRAWGPCPD